LTIDGEVRTFSSPHRYVWPSELDLMARLAGLRPRHRWSDWDRSPFGPESLAVVEQLKTVYGVTLTTEDAHRMQDRTEERP
jgi:hypothetical protein